MALLRLIPVVLVTILFCSGVHADETPRVPKGLIRLGAGAFFSPYALVVDKKARVLTVWREEERKLIKVAASSYATTPFSNLLNTSRSAKRRLSSTTRFRTSMKPTGRNRRKRSKTG
ncbi:MAG: hypothetical protein ABL958_19010 [Bdellovibrionia bacterium]